MVKILVFDTETTGLPPFQIFEEKYPPNNGETWSEYNFRMTKIKKDSNNEKIALDNDPSLWENYKETWPYIVQLSYIAFDTDSKETVVKDVYVDLPTKFALPEYLASIHPISRTAIEEGLKVSRVPVDAALDEFMGYFREADVVTGHNVDFDINMLLAEYTRIGKPDAFEELIQSKKRDKIYCTACKSTNLVKICYEYNCAKPIYKTPKLNQAYYQMFGYAPNESALHNALIDVVACLRVFYRLWFQGIHFNTEPSVNDNTPICGVGQPDIYLELKQSNPENQIITIVNEFTPPGINPDGVGEPGLRPCELIDNDVLVAAMTGETIRKIKQDNQNSSRLYRYKALTSKKRKIENVGGTKRRKTNKRKTNKRKTKKRKTKLR